MTNGQDKGLLKKYTLFLQDFDYPRLDGYHSWDHILKAKPQTDIHINSEANEDRNHWRGKRNMVDLIIEYNESHSNRYLAWTERQQVVERYIPKLGGYRTFRPDIVVFDRIDFSKKHNHYGIFLIEIDGKANHTSDKEVQKDTDRDNFFFDFYNVVTVRIPTWRAHGRKRTYHEMSDITDEMIFRANQLEAIRNR